MSALFSPDVIERELRRLQLEASPYGARATLFNLVVFTRDEYDAEAEEVYSGMFGKRTARIIHISRTPRDESRVSVSARCREEGESESICFQEVLIESGRDEIGSSPGAWTPLLIRSIPVIVLWLDRVIGSEDIISAAMEHADKIIFDSDFLSARRESINELLHVYLEHIHDHGTIAADLAWKRGLALRKLTAAAFNHEKTLPLLDRIRAVRIEGAGAATARLYLLWLAERLDWEYEAPLFVDTEGQKITTEHVSPGAIEDGVEIRITLDDERTLCLAGGANGCGEIEVPGVGTSSRVFTVSTPAEMLQEETDYLYGDRTYLPALQKLDHRL